MITLNIWFRQIAKFGFYFCCFLFLSIKFSLAAENLPQPSSKEDRYLAFISDTHMGFGKANGKWSPYEDFRWPNALAGLLNQLHQLGNGKVDLILVGDIFELWQTPSDISCNQDGDADYGCTIKEAKDLTNRILTAHKKSFNALKEFSKKGTNRIYFIPGNHDAALTHSAVWQEVDKALDAKTGRIIWVKNGIWQSPDKLILAEHGHQIGQDVNKFDNWPQVYDSQMKRFIRPFGENGVQKLFNDEEFQYPIIDNLSPESEGAWLRSQDRGVWGSAKDLARLAWFLIFETSVEQKVDLGGGGGRMNAELTSEEISKARKSFGFKLIAFALPKEDQIRIKLLTKGNTDPEINKLRMEMKKLVNNLPDDSIRALCQHVAIRTDDISCIPITLGGSGLEKLIRPKNVIMRSHLSIRKKSYPNFIAFVYGHTHQLEIGHPVIIPDQNNQSIKVFNSGAFQRLIDIKNFKKRMDNKFSGKKYWEGLKLINHKKDLLPCYTVIHGLHKYGQRKINLKTTHWILSEDHAAKGKFSSIGSSDCTW